MPFDGTFGYLVGKLDVLNVVCSKCERRGRYSVARLIAEHGPDGRVWDMNDVAALIAAQEAPVAKRGPYKKKAA